MNILSVALPPVIGGIIGCITNDIAIKMLFRPYRPVMMGRFQIPFTPGIVPKRQEALAVALGTEVERQFFNADDLEIVFQSDDFTNAVADSVTDLLYSEKTPLYSALTALSASGDAGQAFSYARETFGNQISRAMLEVDYTPLVAGAFGEILKEKNLGGMKRRLAENVLESLTGTISDGIHGVIRNEKESTLKPIVDNIFQEMTDHSVRSIAKQYFPDQELIRKMIAAIYKRFMAGYVRQVVESIDVGGMITEKVRLMDPAAIEALVLSVVGREFRYVVLLGGLIGAAIGTVNIFL